ncbi:MAG: histidine--tRNA ligase [Coriobacteriia bacterium]|nr:histidine--tRNA ligase [Coriobacteriia bacterium]
MINSPVGTFDLLPEEHKFWDIFQEKAKAVFGLYGYTSIQTPFFEQTELFSRGIGEDTDVVSKEMFNVLSGGNLDKLLNGEKVKNKSRFTLRPEGTAGVVRAYIQNNIIPPAKLMYAGPMFRAERPQAGRQRQFMQVGIECIGPKEPSVDAEAINMLARFYDEIGLRHYELVINSMGCPTCRKQYREELVKFLDKLDLCLDCEQRKVVNPLRVLDCKNKDCQSKLEDAPKITDYLCDECKTHYESVKEKLILPYTEDPMLVRGLDYYTNTVFEVKFPGLDAIAGGGRYDGLVKQLGGQDTPGFGFALGYERTLLALQQLEFQFEPAKVTDCFVASVDDSTRDKAFEITQTLRDVKISAEMDHMGRSLKSQFKFADKLHSKYTVILGPDELANNQVTVRDMKTHNQDLIDLDKLTAYILNGGK